MYAFNKEHQPTTNQMKNTQTAVVELIGLLSQAIDILRNHDAEDDANYIETQMEETIKLIKSK
jgi:predicted lipoprotein